MFPSDVGEAILDANTARIAMAITSAIDIQISIARRGLVPCFSGDMPNSYCLVRKLNS